MGMGDSFILFSFSFSNCLSLWLQITEGLKKLCRKNTVPQKPRKNPKTPRKLIKRKVKVITIFTSELQFKFFNRHVFCSRSSIVDPSILPTWTYNTLGVTGTSRGLIVETVGYENEWTIRYGLPLFQVFSSTLQYILMAIFSVKQWDCPMKNYFEVIW